ncbi:chorismate mutase [Dongia sp.]|uniref:chorismate mutase n=1 Tax=Dongia sp. TaxID=1977262 RepID=UPI003752FFA7
MKSAALANDASALPRCADMKEVRAEIDAIDRRMVALIAERLHYIDEAARIKADRDTVRDDARVADVLAKVRAEALRLGCDPEVVVAAYRALVEASIAHEFTAFDAKRR